MLKRPAEGLKQQLARGDIPDYRGIFSQIDSLGLSSASADTVRPVIYQTSLFLILLLIGMIFTLIFYWPFSVLIQIISGIAVYYDATAIRAGASKDFKGFLAWTPELWGWFVGILWIFGLPSYLIWRRQIWANANLGDATKEASKEELLLFEDNYKKISQSANYIILLNGIILAAYAAVLTKTPNPSVSVHNLTVLITTSTDIYNVTGISPQYEMPTTNLFLVGLHLLVIVPLFASMVSCVGAINTGLWDRLNKSSVNNKEILNREDAAFTHYGRSAKFFGLGVIGLYAFTFSQFFDPFVAILIYIIICIPILIFMRLFNVFDRFVAKD